MKKKLLFTVFTVLMSMPLLHAKSGIKVICGDLSVIKNSDVTATVIFDYTDLKIEGKALHAAPKIQGERLCERLAIRVFD